MTRLWIQKTITNPVFWGICLVQAFLFTVGVEAFYYNVIPCEVIYYLIVSLELGVIVPVLPVLAAIPFAHTLLCTSDEHQEYYLKVRSKRNVRYYYSKFIAAIIVTVLLELLSVGLFTLVCIFWGQGNFGVEDLAQYIESTSLLATAQTGTSVWIYVLFVLSICSFAILWPLVALVTSCFTKKTFVIFAMPYVVYEAVTYATQMLGYDLFDTNEILMGGENYELALGGFVYSIGYTCLLVILLALIYGIRMRRVLKYENA